MKERDALDGILGNLGGLGNVISQVTENTKPRDQVRDIIQKEESISKIKTVAQTQQSPIKRTPEQIKAVEEAQNSQRGRGKYKGDRKMIAFKSPVEMITAIENIHYATGITKNDLYEEALLYIINKYRTETK